MTENKEYFAKDYGLPVNAPATTGESLLTHLRVSVVATLTLAVLVCGVYPLVVWALAQALFHDKANGSLLRDAKGQVIGSALIGQNFSDARFFHPRPSAAGNGYDPTASGGSNLGPTSAKLLNGTTKDSAFTVIAHDSSHADGAQAGRTEGVFVSATDKTITISTPVAAGATATKSTYNLDPAVAVTAQGRTLKKTSPPVGANVELKFNTATPPAVTAVTVVDKAVEGVVSAVDATAGKITLPGEAGAASTDYTIGSGALVMMNGKADVKAGDIPVGATVRILTATVVDNDGLSDRVIHYCEDNGIEYTSAIPTKSFEDDDGIDDVKLINAFNAATDRKITPKSPIPADAVTASGSGLDPHISVANALVQVARVAKARGVSDEQVKAVVAKYTDGPDLGLLGDAGVNVLLLNLALEAEHPAPAAPTTLPAAPTTLPAATR